MKKFVLSSLVLASLAFSADVTISGFSSPESVLATKDGVFVSNVGKELNPTAKDGDGFISQIDYDGKIINLKLFEGLDAPKGIALVEGVLYVADIDVVRGYDIKNKKEVFNLKIEGTQFLNDITSKGNNTLYVSASDAGKVYEINIRNTSYKVLADFPAANGLAYTEKHQRLFAVSFGENAQKMFDPTSNGRLVEIDTKNGVVRGFGKLSGKLDGLVIHEDKMYASDWVGMDKIGVIKVYDPRTKKESTLALEKFAGPADFSIYENKLYIPQMLSGQVSIIDIPK